MPSRPSLHLGRSTSPRQSPNAVNDVVSALSRKWTASHVESVPTASPTAAPAPRRASFSMDNILHPKGHHKKHDESKDRDSSRKEKRHSLAMRTGPGSKSKDRVAGPSPRVAPVSPGKFDIIIESPPLVVFGQAASSTGALLSGRLSLLVEDPTGEVTLDTFVMALSVSVSTKKPIGKDCRDCQEKQDEMKKWKFLSEPKTFLKDQDNQFPFSYLLPGSLPATTHSQLGSLTYALHAVATTSTGETITYTHPLTVQRAIPPGPDRSSIRIFPPTNLTGRVTLPPVVHPIGTFPVQMQLSGVVEKKKETQTRWRLRKVMWRIEEHSKVISTACAKHQNKVSDGKAIQHAESKTLGSDELKSGWKSDFDTIGGEITLEFDATLTTKSTHKATCDVDSASGLEVKHNLVVELIVAEEFCPNKNTRLITPTGAARVLRMQFALVVTQRTGMGISWDEEMPPMYEDVPASPPGYGNADRNVGAWGGAIMEDYEGPELEYVDLERMQSSNPNEPPVYRERDPAEVTQFLSARSQARPAPDTNSGLPVRSRYRTDSDENIIPGPSGSRQPLGGWRLDELEAEPPQYALHGRENSQDSQQAPEEDYGEGEASTAPVH